MLLVKNWKILSFKNLRIVHKNEHAQKFHQTSPGLGVSLKKMGLKTHTDPTRSATLTDTLDSYLIVYCL